MLLGLLFAVLASVGSGVGSAVEAFGIRRAAARSTGRDSLGPLLREPVYFAGLAIDLLGFVFMVIALQVLPLFLVQAVVACSVGVTALIVAATGRPLGRPGWIALGASVCGLILLGISSQASDAPPLAPEWHWVLLGMSVPLAAIGVLAVRLRPPWSAVLLAFAAGLAFTCVAVASRGLNVPNSLWNLVSQPDLWAIVIDGILGTVLFALALQRGKVTMVAAVTFTTNTVVPSVVGILVLGDQVRSGYAGVATAGFLVAVGGAVALARYAGPLPPDDAAPAVAASPASA